MTGPVPREQPFLIRGMNKPSQPWDEFFEALKNQITENTSTDLDFAGNSGTGSVDLDTQTLTISGTANRVITSATGQTITISGPQDIATSSTPTFGGLTLNGNLTMNVSSIGGAGTGLSFSGANATFSGDVTHLSDVYIQDERIYFENGADTANIYIPTPNGTSGLTITSNDNLNLDITGNTNINSNTNISGTLGVTGVATFTIQPIMSSLTASQAVFTDGSKGLVSNAITGTGNVVMSASPTLSGTVNAASISLSGNLTVTGSILGNASTAILNISSGTTVNDGANIIIHSSASANAGQTWIRNGSGVSCYWDADGDFFQNYDATFGGDIITGTNSIGGAGSGLSFDGADGTFSSTLDVTGNLTTFGSVLHDVSSTGLISIFSNGAVEVNHMSDANNDETNTDITYRFATNGAVNAGHIFGYDDNLVRFSHDINTNTLGSNTVYHIVQTGLVTFEKPVVFNGFATFNEDITMSTSDLFFSNGRGLGESGYSPAITFDGPTIHLNEIAYGTDLLVNASNSRLALSGDTNSTTGGNIWVFGASSGNASEIHFNSDSTLIAHVSGEGVFIDTIKSGSTQANAGAAAGEVWSTASHASLPDNVLMIGV